MTVSTGWRKESRDNEVSDCVYSRQTVSSVHNDWLLYNVWQAWNSICMSGTTEYYQHLIHALETA